MKHSKQDNSKRCRITCMATQLIIFKRCKNTTRYGKKMILFIQGYQTCRRRQVPASELPGKSRWRDTPCSTVTNFACTIHFLCLSQSPSALLFFSLLWMKPDTSDVSSDDTNESNTTTTTNNKLVDPEKVKRTQSHTAPCFVIFQRLKTVHTKTGGHTGTLTTGKG